MAIENNIILEGVRLMARNFSGRATEYNAEGKRNFCAIISPEVAQQMLEDGWNVKTLEPRNPDDDLLFYIQVSVHFGKFPPAIFLVTKHSKKRLYEDTVNVLDYAEIENVDIQIRPYNWELKGGKKGTKAYVKSMYVTIREDPLDEKYYDIPEGAVNASGDFDD